MNANRLAVHDAELPQLDRVLDTTRMRETFDRVLLGAGATERRRRVGSCEIERVKYKPGTSCMVCYRIGVEDLSTGRVQSQRLCARVFPPGQSASRYRKARSVRPRGTRFAQPVQHLDELAMVLWTFPNERKLHGLPAVSNRRWLAAHVVPELMRLRWWKRWEVLDLHHEVAHYAPEQSCSLKLELQLGDEQGRRRAWTVYGKTYHNDDGARTHANMRALTKFCRRSEHLATASALHYDTRLNLLWQEGVSGSDLFSLTRQGRADVGVMQRVAAALAELHASELPHTPTLDLEHTLAQLQRQIALLARVRPDLAQRYRALEQTLRFTAPAKSELATLHGDLHAKNVLVDSHRVALIDLDDLQRGPVARELGSWLACGAYRALLLELPLAQDEGNNWIDHDPLLAHYQALTHNRVGRPAIDWFTAAALISERSYRCVSRLKSGRARLLDDLLAAAEKLIRRTRRAA